MTVQELMNKISNKTFNLEKSLEVKKYIPIMDKKRFVTDVVAACTDNIDDFITVDKFKMNIYFDMRALGVYTNLEIADDFDDMIAQYDVLCEKEILSQIIALFEMDYCVMHTVLENVLDELLVQNSIDMQVVKIANKISHIIDSATDSLNELNLSSILPDGMNINGLIDMISALK